FSIRSRDAPLFLQPVESLPYAGKASRDDILRNIPHDRLKAGLRAHLSDTTPHQAAAQHANRTDLVHRFYQPLGLPMNPGSARAPSPTCARRSMSDCNCVWTRWVTLL